MLNKRAMYVNAFRRSGLSRKEWGNLFHYGTAAYTATSSKLAGKLNISNREVAFLRAIEFLLDRGLFQEFIETVKK